jgi:hypothetical protein
MNKNNIVKFMKQTLAGVAALLLPLALVSIVAPFSQFIASNSLFLGVLLGWKLSPLVERKVKSLVKA